MKTLLASLVIAATAAWQLSTALAQNVPDKPLSGAPGGVVTQSLAPVPGSPPTQPKKGRAGAAVYTVGSARNSESIPPLVIQFSSTNQSVVQDWEEDLTVMTHLIEQALNRAAEDEGGNTAKAMGIQLWATASRSVRPLYLEGFGALFMIKVNFPVLPPSKADDEKAERTETEWEIARQELYGRSIEMLAKGGGESAAEYDPEQVDQLKKELVQALKNVSNFRHLKPEEYVSVTVFGSPSIAKAKPPRRKKGEPAAPLKLDPDTGLPLPKEVDRMIQNQFGGGASKVSRPGTVLTLRVKKSDIDAFSAGKLDTEAFQKKIATNSYFGSGYGITSLNSWIRAAIQDIPFGVK